MPKATNPGFDQVFKNGNLRPRIYLSEEEWDNLLAHSVLTISNDGKEAYIYDIPRLIFRRNGAGYTDPADRSAPAS